MAALKQARAKTEVAMPAVSQAQRGYLNATKGHAWVKAHHFDNTGKLPAHVSTGTRKAKARSRGTRKKQP
jgi:hypothetical protein